MNTADLQKRIQSDAQLSALSDSLQREIRFRADTAFQFDPFLMVAIISIIIQIIVHCREKTPTTDIRNAIRDARALPPRRLIRLKRRLNKFWLEYCAQTGMSSSSKNPFFDTVLELGENAPDSELDALLALAEAERT
jgi:hypothetical protein